MRRQVVAGLLVGLSLPLLAQEYRLGQNVQPSQQSVYLKVDPAQDNFRGRTEIVLKVHQDTSALHFHGVDISMAQAELKQGDRRIPLSLKKGENGIVTASAPQTIKAGSYHLLMEFSGPFNRNSVGLYKYSDEGRAYLCSQFEMTDARRCFPCFDEPGFKIPYQLTVEAPSDQKVYNNSPEVGATDKQGWTVHNFAPTPPIPSYLVAVAVGPFDEVPVTGMSVPGRIVASRGKTRLAGYAQKQTPKILAYLEGYFGEKVPYPRLDQLAIKEFPFGGMENPGMLTYQEPDLLVNEATATLDTRTDCVGLIAHEIAHQWFGNQVTMKWWDDLWLNEAFATWMANKVVEDLYPELEISLRTLPKEMCMTADANLAMRPIQKEIKCDADILDNLGLAYMKGKAVLAMVERWVGTKDFQKGMRAYLARHRFGSAEAADLWNALSEASGKPVESVLRPFITQPGYPLVSVSRQGRQLRFSQRRFLAGGVSGPKQTWSLPLLIRYGKGDRKAEAQLLLQGESATLELAFEPEWILPDAGGIGYFRWQMGSPELKGTIAHRDQMTPQEKLAFILNLGALQTAGVVTVGEYLESISPFLSDSHPSVVSLAVEGLGGQGVLFVNEGNRKDWNVFVEQNLSPIKERFGITPKQGEHPRAADLRKAFLDLYNRDQADPLFLAVAEREALAFLEGSAKVDSDLVSSYLNVAALYGDEALLEKTWKAFTATSDPQRRAMLLKMLASFGKPGVQEKAMDRMLNPEVSVSELQTLLYLFSSGESRRQRLQDWLFSHYSAVRSRLPAAFLGDTVSCLAGAHDPEQLQKIVAFFSQQPDPDGAIKGALEQLQETVKAAISKREKGQQAFDACLRQAAGGSK